VKQNIALKDKKELRRINGKCSNVGSADENE
jgi:hypothetical protein